MVRIVLAILAALLVRGQDVRSLTILHTNDLHAHLERFAQLATAIKQERAHCPACIVLNAGDLVQGTPVSTLYKGDPVFEIANRLGFDAATLGNHEFDYGAPEVLRFLKIARYPIVSANLEDGQNRPVLRPYVILNAGGLKVAVIGAIMNNLVGTYANKENVGSWHTAPVVETVGRYAREIGGRADVIVLLAHFENSDADEVLREVPEVPVIVQGHVHAGYDAAKQVDGRIAVQLKSYAVELGRLDLRVDVAKHKIASFDWKRIPIDAKLAPDPEVAKVVSRWESKVSKVVDVKIGESRRALAGEDLRMLIETCTREETGADFAYINEGNIRDTLPQGTILARNIWNILPFDNHLVTGTFKGSELPPGVKQEHQIDPAKQYTLTVPDFSAANQVAELHTSGLVFDKIGPMHRDACIDWVKHHPVIQ